jgi:hypothetical protein
VNCLNKEKFLSDIDKFGYTVLAIDATDYLPSFAYTVGLWKNFKHAEIIAFGLITENLTLLLHTAAELVKSAQAIQTDKIYTHFFEKGKTAFVNVDKRNIADYFGQAINFYDNDDFPVLELVWADRNDKFPWESGFEEEFLRKQPLLDRNADFKYFESKNTGVFTTKQHIKEGKPILRVVHDFDGDWQFLTGEPSDENAVLVALKCMIENDETLNGVFDLDYGEMAERKGVNDKWTRGKADKGEI